MPSSPPPPPSLTSADEWRLPASGNAHADHDGIPSALPARWLHLAAYHLANASLAFVAFVLVTGGLALCGVGVVLLATTLRCAYYLAEIDARFHNTLVASDRDKIALADDLVVERRPLLPLYHHLDPPPPPHLWFASGDLQRLTPRAVVLLVYFAVVKLVLGILSAAGLLLLLTCSWALVSEKFPMGLDIDEPTQLWTPFECFVVAVASVAGLHVVARVAMAATRFVCCARA